MKHDVTDPIVPSRSKALIDHKLVILLLYGAVVGWLLARHAMWRDEAQLWLVAHSSDSVFELIKNKEYEARPLTWFLICWLFSRLSDTPEILKFFNFCVSLGTAYLILYHFPISLLKRTLIVLTFPLLLGYAVISEDYMLGVFALAVFCIAYLKGISRNPKLILIGLLASTHFLFWLIAVPFLILETFQMIRNKNELKNAKTFVSCGAAFALVLISIWSIWPRNNNPFGPRINFDLHSNLIRASNGVLQSWLPFANVELLRISNFHFWIFLVILVWSGLIGLFVLLFAVDKTIIATAAVSCCLLIGNITYGYSYYWWHFAVLFIFILFLLVLSEHLLFKNGNPNQSLRYRYLSIASVVFLLPNAFATISLPGQNFLTDRPYSNAKYAAQTIRDTCNDCTVLVAYEMTGLAVSAYLDSRAVYYVDKQRFGTYGQWGDRTQYSVTWELISTSASQFSSSIIVTPNWDDAPKEFRRIARHTNAIWSDENFDVYTLNR